MRRLSTGTAKELGLTATVGFLDMPTASALLAGVFRVHQDDRHTCQPRLVVDELPQLGEAPIAVSRSLLGSSSPGPRANAGQVFQGNRAVRALSFCYETLANLVVDVFLEAALAAREFPQVAFGRQAAARLQVRAQPLHPLAVMLDRLAGQHVAVAGGGDIRHAQVHAQGFRHIARFRVGEFACRQQEEHAVEQHQVSLALAGLQEFALALARAIRDTLATVYCPDRNFIPVGVPRQNTVIVSNAAQRLEGARRAPLQPVGVRHLCQTADDHLRREVEALAHLVVGQVLHPVAVEDLRPERPRTDEVTRGIGRFKRLLEGGVLVFRRVEAHLRNQFHVMKYSTEVLQCQNQGAALPSHA